MKPRWLDGFLPGEKDFIVTRPNFFIIGAPKCGTTALSGYLSEHPGVFFSPKKEPCYFDFDLSKEEPFSPEGYLDLFRGADPAVHTAVGEGSTSYLFSARAAGEILKFNPEAKFIVMLRNPLDLVQALHSEQVFRGKENIADFEPAWRAEADRKKGGRLPAFCPEPRQLFYSEWGKLGEQLERFYSTVEKTKVHVIFFDDFARDTKGEYEKVLGFLGLSPDGRSFFPKMNENKKVVWPRLQIFYGMLGRMIRDLKLAAGISHRFGFLSRIRGLNRQVKGRRPLREEFQSELRFFFREDVRKLSRILGRDLSHWVEPS